MKQGRLGYNSSNDRYGLLSSDLWIDTGFHCGEGLDCLLYTSDIPVIKGSALKALEDPNGEWGDKIMELMDAVDSYIPDPQRDTDKPFVMPVEDVFSITGRGTVATGRVEAGVLHVSDEVEIVGIKEETRKVVVTGIEMFRKLLDEAQAGDNIGALLRGVRCV